MPLRLHHAALFAVLTACNPQITIPVQQETIQGALDQKFPVKKGSAALVEVVLRDPKISLPGKSRVGIDVDLDVIVPDLREVEPPPGKTDGRNGGQAALGWAVDAARSLAKAPRVTLNGGLAVSGQLDYEPSTGSFLLRQASVDRIAVDGLQPEHAHQVKVLASGAVEMALDRYPVYSLDESTTQMVAKLVLKDVRAEEGAVVVTFGK